MLLQEKLRVAEDLFSERGCFQTEAGRGCFLLARPLLEVGARATGEAASGRGSVP